MGASCVTVFITFDKSFDKLAPPPLPPPVCPSSKICLTFAGGTEWWQILCRHFPTDNRFDLLRAVTGPLPKCPSFMLCRSSCRHLISFVLAFSMIWREGFVMRDAMKFLFSRNLGGSRRTILVFYWRFDHLYWFCIYSIWIVSMTLFIVLSRMVWLMFVVKGCMSISTWLKGVPWVFR